MAKVTHHENGQVTIDTTQDEPMVAATRPAKMTSEQTFVNSETGQFAKESENGVNMHVRSYDVITVRSDPETIPEGTKVVSTAAKEPNVDYEDPNGPIHNFGVTGPVENPNEKDKEKQKEAKPE